MINKSIKLFMLFMFFSAFIYAEETYETSKQEIIVALQKWPQDFNAKNLEATCGLFAADLVASYPGVPDRNYKEMCASLTKVLEDQNKIFTYSTPTIEQVMVEGDTAIVRLNWCLKVFDKKTSKIETVKEKGLDVFKRQPDGSWKIVISYAYPDL